MTSLISRAKKVAFQGEPGAFGNQAAREALPDAAAIPKPSFEDAVEAVRSGETDVAIIPIENALHGRIADIHTFFRKPASISWVSTSCAFGCSCWV